MGARPVRRLLADFRNFAGARLPLLAAVMIGGALAEGLGIVLLVPLLALGEGGARLPPVFDVLSSFLPVGGGLWAGLALFLLLMGLRSVLLYARDLTMTRLEADYTTDLRLRSAASLAAGGWKRAHRVGLSGMQSLLLTEIPRCMYAAHEAMMIVVAGAILLIQFAIAAWLSPALAGVAGALIACGLAASWLLLRRTRRRGIAISAHGEESSAAAFRLHSGLKSALAQGTVSGFLSEYDKSLTRLSGETIGFGRDRARTRAIAAVGAACAAATLLALGRQWLGLPFATLGTLLILFARMSGPAQNVQQSVQALSAHAPAFDAIEGSLGPLTRAPVRDDGGAERLEWQQVRLTDVSYAHPDQGFAIVNASLSVERGQWVGLSGPSGGGKTTLVDLAVGLLEPDQGQLLIDDAPVDALRLARWRAGLAYVGQNEMTFDAPVRQNLLADCARTVADEKLWSILELTGLASRLRAQGQDLDTPLGDRGSLLSGGERQRLGIARALLREPQLIVLDEATNALDQESETALLTRIRALEPRPALLLVAHRPGPLTLCDRVVNVDGGHVA